MITPTDAENIESMLAGGGWQWLSAHITREWGPSGLRYQKAVQDAAASQEAVIELQKVLAAQAAVLGIMQAPVSALASAKGKMSADDQRREVSMSRRGPGL